jgi:hypothetical protein
MVARFDADSGPAATLVRAWASAEFGRQLGQSRLVARITGGMVESGGAIPEQFLLRAGGPVTAPGYAFHQFAGDRLLTTRLELQTPVPFPAIPLGRWGTAPSRATLAPFAGAAYSSTSSASGPALEGIRPYVGLGTLVLFDLIRLDVARGLRDGRWRFGVDVMRDFWPIL